MLRKTITAGLTLALLLTGGGYFSNMGTETGAGFAYAATSYGSSNQTPYNGQRGSQVSQRTHRTQSYGPVSVSTVNESTMLSKMTNTSRYAVYVGQGSTYTEYYSTASNADDAARAILARVSYGYFQTSNPRLYNSMLRYGSFSSVKTYSNHGNTVYCFRH